MRNPRAFTLIELLVVVTIIVVLLALLTPAIDKAMYAAKMAVCGANLRSMGWMATAYTQDNKRYYPVRAIKSGPVCAVNQINDCDAGVTNPLPVDERPQLRTGFPINKIFNDPLCESVDFDQALSSSQVEISYNIWWGFRFVDNTVNGANIQEEGMYRLYGRFTYTPINADQYSFAVLASDLEACNGSGVTRPELADGTGTAFSSHPDHDGIMVNIALQDDVENGGNETSQK